MNLHLTNGYPHPYPTYLPQDQQDEINNNLTQLTIPGVRSFELKHTVTIEFENQAMFDDGKELTGWATWDADRLILEAAISVQDGYLYPAITVRRKAYCGLFVSPDKSSSVISEPT